MALATFERLNAVFLETIEDPAVRVQKQGPNWLSLRHELAQKLAQVAQGDATAVVWLLLQQVRAAVAADFADLLVQVLDAVDNAGDSVRQVVADKALPEAVQREAVRYLGSRRDPRCRATLLAVLADEFRSTQVRRYALDAIVDSAMVDALPTLRSMSAATAPRGELGLERVLAARLRLGDFSVLRQLLDLYPHVASSWRAPAGNQVDAIDLVASVGGLDAVLDLIAAPAAPSSLARLRILAEFEASPGIRQWALVELAQRDAEDAVAVLLGALGDRNRGVAATACCCLCSLAARARLPLTALAADGDAGQQQRLWAIYTLALLGDDVTALLAIVPDARISLPLEPAPALRAALAALSLRYVTAQTDLRWLIEAQCAGYRRWEGSEAQMADLLQALRSAGLAPRPNEQFPQPAAPADYWKLALRNEDYLYVSRQGPFVSFAVENIVAFELGTWTAHTQVEDLTDVDPLGERALKRRRCQEAAATAGFHWLDRALLDLRLPGLDGRRTDPENTSIWTIAFGGEV